MCLVDQYLGSSLFPFLRYNQQQQFTYQKFNLLIKKRINQKHTKEKVSADTYLQPKDHHYRTVDTFEN